MSPKVIISCLKIKTFEGDCINWRPWRFLDDPHVKVLLSYLGTSMLIFCSLSPSGKSLAGRSMKVNPTPTMPMIRYTKFQHMEIKKRISKAIASTGVPWRFLEDLHVKDLFKYLGTSTMSRRDFADKHLPFLHAEVIHYLSR